MAWRRRRADPAVPERLARFVPQEWPGACPHEQLRVWQEACAEWLAADSDAPPRPGCGVWWLAGHSRRRLPFGEDGDAIDVLRESERISRQIPPCPHEYRPAQYRGPQQEGDHG